MSLRTRRDIVAHSVVSGKAVNDVNLVQVDIASGLATGATCTGAASLPLGLYKVHVLINDVDELSAQSIGLLNCSAPDTSAVAYSYINAPTAVTADVAGASGWTFTVTSSGVLTATAGNGPTTKAGLITYSFEAL